MFRTEPDLLQVLFFWLFTFFFPENHELVHTEIQDTGEAEGNEVTDNRVPLEDNGHTVENQHFEYESGNAGEIVFPERAKEHTGFLPIDSVFPDIEICSQIVYKYCAFERNAGRYYILLKVGVPTKLMRQTPQDNSIRNRTQQCGYDVLNYFGK